MSPSAVQILRVDDDQVDVDVDLEDRTTAYEHYVADYKVKSKPGEDFLNVLSMLDAYGRVVEFP